MDLEFEKVLVEKHARVEVVPVFLRVVEVMTLEENLEVKGLVENWVEWEE